MRILIDDFGVITICWIWCGRLPYSTDFVFVSVSVFYYKYQSYKYVGLISFLFVCLFIFCLCFWHTHHVIDNYVPVQSFWEFLQLHYSTTTSVIENIRGATCISDAVFDNYLFKVCESSGTSCRSCISLPAQPHIATLEDSAITNSIGQLQKPAWLQWWWFWHKWKYECHWKPPCSSPPPSS